MTHITATATPSSNTEGRRPTAAALTTAQDTEAPGEKAARSPEAHQIEAIGDVCTLAATASDPARRSELLALAQRALAAVQTPETEPTPDEQLAAAGALDALVATHRLQVKEWDTGALDEGLRDLLMVWHGEIDGQWFIVVPKGQPPVERLHAVRTLLAFLARQGVEA